MPMLSIGTQVGVAVLTHTFPLLPALILSSFISDAGVIMLMILTHNLNSNITLNLDYEMSAAWL